MQSDICKHDVRELQRPNRTEEHSSKQVIMNLPTAEELNATMVAVQTPEHRKGNGEDLHHGLVPQPPAFCDHLDIIS